LLLPSQIVIAGDTERRALVQTAGEFGFDAGQQKKLLAGEIVIHKLGEEGKRELAIRAAALIDATADRTFEGATSLEFLKIDATVLELGEIPDGSVDSAAFSKLTLPADELDALVDAAPGTDFNLSKSEFEAVAAVKQDKSAAMQAYREILAARVESYRKQGLAGIAPYARGGEETDVSQDLQSVLTRGNVSDPEVRSFVEALRSYPAAGPDDVEHRFVWLLQNLNDRPAVILAHRMTRKGKRISLLQQRNFFVGHTMDAMQTLSGLIGQGDEAIAIYANRTYTGQVAGFGSGAAHSIGRKIMSGEIEAALERILAKLRSGS
jgi:hypothetical protein